MDTMKELEIVWDYPAGFGGVAGILIRGRQEEQNQRQESREGATYPWPWRKGLQVTVCRGWKRPRQIFLRASEGTSSSGLFRLLQNIKIMD